jgi:predicted double-glycine peptidase
MGNLAMIIPAIALLANVAGSPSFNAEQRRTYEAVRFEGIARQIAEPSCATASIVTLVAAQFGERLDEEELWFGYLASLPDAMQQLTIEQGLSIADIMRILDAKSYHAIPVRTDLLSLKGANRPAIVFLEREGPVPMRHFAVFEQIRGTDVILLDPAQGRRRLHIEEFRRHWKGIAIFVNKRAGTI